MAAATAVGLPYLTVDEYLHTSYEPDADYVDGVLEERNLVEWDHGDLQGQIYAIFRANAKAWGIRVAPEVRVQVAATRFRVPDVCVVSAAHPREQIVHTPPVLCIEILSPEDRYSRMQARCQDYLRMGIPEVWIFNPELHTVQVLRSGIMVEHRDGTLKLEGTPIELNIAEVFGTLDLS